jgi:four helix bundle protein
MSYYKDLKIWKYSLEVVRLTYLLVEIFPKSELFSLTDQMKRASISIWSNIAEWSGRGSIADNLRFLYMSQWSATELEAQIEISKTLGFVSTIQTKELDETLLVLQKMLTKYIQSKKNNQS